MEFLMRARIFMLPAAGFSIALSALLLTDETKRNVALPAAGITVLLFAGLAANNNKAWVREASEQANLEKQMWKLLQGADPDRPIVFMPESADVYNAERPQDLIETMYARLAFEHPEYDTRWYTVYNGSLKKGSQEAKKKQMPFVIQVSRDNKKLTDITDRILEKMAILQGQTLSESLHLTRHEKTPLWFKPAEIGLKSNVILFGYLHSFSAMQLHLHPPFSGEQAKHKPPDFD